VSFNFIQNPKTNLITVYFELTPLNGLKKERELLYLIIQINFR